MNKLFKIISIINIIPLSSCFLIFDHGYRGDINTTLAGFIEISKEHCLIPSEDLSSDNETKYLINVVFHLITVGDKYVSVCVSKNNDTDVRDAIQNPHPDPNAAWFPGRFLNITFYASDTIAQPGSSTVGQASEVLISGYDQNNNYTSSFCIGPEKNGNPQGCYDSNEDKKCRKILSDNAYLDTIWLADLDMTVFEKKPIIVARVPLCGNYPLGSAANPLYSEKNLKK